MIYHHAINVNVTGSGKKPIVGLWCMDCVEEIGSFDQINSLDSIEEAVDEHCTRPSRRQELTERAQVNPPDVLH